MKKTIHLVKMLESIGINAIALHSRYPDDRTKKKKACHEKAKFVFEHIRIPKIINGDIYTLEDGYNIKKETGANSLMIARGAQNNCSIFRSQGLLPIYDVSKRYIQIAAQLDHNKINTKYVIVKMYAQLQKNNTKFNELYKAKKYTQINDCIDRILLK